MVIGPFRDEYSFLSNFHPVDVTLGGRIYPTVEHAFQAAKTVDPKERMWVRVAPTPAGAKQRGKKVHLRPDWEAAKVTVLEDLVRQKFLDPGLREQLLATGDEELVEVNTWRDRYWGMCRDKTGQLVGQNNLGRILMRVRDAARG